MVTLNKAENYRDVSGNRIIFNGVLDKSITINFRGSNNTLILDDNVALGHLNAQFDCNNGTIRIGSSRGVAPLKANIRIGQDSTVTIGDNVSNVASVGIVAVEGTHVTIGNDCMLASQTEIRTDDAHPIFDVRTGKRTNPSRSIWIGNHVWLARRTTVFGGSSIGDGSILGFGSILKGKIPNNCIAVGTPAKVVRRDIAWERPHLSLREPYYKPDADSIEKSSYWNLTDDSDLPDPTKKPRTMLPPTGEITSRIRALRVRAWHLRRRILTRN